MFNLDDKIGVQALIYLIVCSRGPGSETLTANIYKPASDVWVVPEKLEDETDWDYQVRELDIGKLRCDIENHIGEEIGEGCFGITSLEKSIGDEGLSYLIEADITYRQLLRSIIKWEAMQETMGLDFQTAVYRAIVNNFDVSIEEAKWSSVGGWRNTSLERMPMWQVEQCMELFNLTKEAALVCDCSVLRESLKKPSVEYSGC